jgi:hypothetical protein
MFLHKKTVEALRGLAAQISDVKGRGKFFVGRVIEEHLARHPLPSTLKPKRFVTRALGRPRLSPEERAKREWAKMSDNDKALLKEFNKLLKADQKRQAKEAREAAKAAKVAAA